MLESTYLLFWDLLRLCFVRAALYSFARTLLLCCAPDHGRAFELGRVYRFGFYYALGKSCDNVVLVVCFLP